MSLLKIHDLAVSFPGEFGRFAVVQGINMAIEEGEVVAVIGESGCGKTITALSILRLLPTQALIEKGRIVFHGKDLLAMSEREIRMHRMQNISIIFQDPMSRLNPVTTVGSQIKNVVQLVEGGTARHTRERAVELLNMVNFPDTKRVRNMYPHQLSGGMQQRVMIAMALAATPKLLIADEPTTALDVTIQAQIVELLRQLQKKTGMAILLITHDFGLVNELADKVVVMYSGKDIETGMCAEILDQPRHPYTQSLIRSVPSLASRGLPLPELHGKVPAPNSWSTGCRFASHCLQVMPICWEACPGVTALSSSHRFSCHTAGKVLEQ